MVIETAGRPSVVVIFPLMLSYICENAPKEIKRRRKVVLKCNGFRIAILIWINSKQSQINGVHFNFPNYFELF